MQGKFKLDVEQGARTVKKGEDTRFHRMDKGEHNYLASPEDKSTPRLEAPSNLPPLDVSDDGHMAVEAKGDVPKVMFMEAGDIGPTNEALAEAGSSYRLVNKGQTLTVPDLNNTPHLLVAVMPANITNGTEGLEMTGPQQCIEMAETVISKSRGNAYRTFLMDVATENLPEVQREGLGKTLAGMVGEYAMATRRGEEKPRREQLAKAGAVGANAMPDVPRAMEMVVGVKVQLADKKPATATRMHEAVKAENEERERVVLKSGTVYERDKMLVTILDPALQSEEAYTQLFGTARFGGLVKRSFWKKTLQVEQLFAQEQGESDETYTPKLRRAAEEKEDSLVDTLTDLTPEELEQALRALGLNEFVKLKIGQAFGVTAATKSTSEAMGFPYHWAGVIAQRGDDVVTLENYARGETTVEDDGRWYLQMYGPLKKVEVSEEGVLAEDKSVDKDYWKEGTFHGQWKEDFSPEGGSVPFTVGVGTKPTEVASDEDS